MGDAKRRLGLFGSMFGLAAGALSLGSMLDVVPSFSAIPDWYDNKGGTKRGSYSHRSRSAKQMYRKPDHRSARRKAKHKARMRRRRALRG